MFTLQAAGAAASKASRAVCKVNMLSTGDALEARHQQSLHVTITITWLSACCLLHDSHLAVHCHSQHQADLQDASPSKKCSSAIS